MPGGVQPNSLTPRGSGEGSSGEQPCPRDSSHQLLCCYACFRSCLVETFASAYVSQLLGNQTQVPPACHNRQTLCQQEPQRALMGATRCSELSFGPAAENSLFLDSSTHADNGYAQGTSPTNDPATHFSSGVFLFRVARNLSILFLIDSCRLPAAPPLGSAPTAMTADDLCVLLVPSA